MLQGTTHKGFEEKNLSWWSSVDMDALQRDGRVQEERGDGMTKVTVGQVR